MIKRILVPVDFSEPALRALDYAVEFGRGPELTVLHVIEPVYYPMAGDVSGVGYDMTIVYQELERAARQQLSRIAAKLRARRVRARTLLCVGAPHRAIVETAKKLKADLIVMSTHGRTGLSHAVMGSVAERVVRTAACPVLTVRGRPRRRVATRPRRQATGTSRRKRAAAVRARPR
jgi:nucleotide-binding universal stress UspA family protein